MSDQERQSQPDAGPEVKVTSSGGNLPVVVLVLVVTLIAVAVAFMLAGAGSEAGERSDPSTTTVQ